MRTNWRQYIPSRAPVDTISGIRVASPYTPDIESLAATRAPALPVTYGHGASLREKNPEAWADLESSLAWSMPEQRLPAPGPSIQTPGLSVLSKKPQITYGGPATTEPTPASLPPKPPPAPSQRTVKLVSGREIVEPEHIRVARERDTLARMSTPEPARIPQTVDVAPGYTKDKAGNVRKIRPGQYGYVRQPSDWELRTTAKRKAKETAQVGRILAARERMIASGVDPHTAYLYSIGRRPKTIPPEIQAERNLYFRREKQNRITEIVFQQELSSALRRARQGLGPESLNARLTGEAASAVYEAVGWKKEGPETGAWKWVKPRVQQELPTGWRIDPSILQGLLTVR